MGKKKIAICMDDEVYQERFVRCLMNHYEQQYEIHSFCGDRELQVMESFDGILTDKRNLMEKYLSERNVEEVKIPMLYLTDGEQFQNQEKLPEHMIWVDKYQEVYKIMEQLEKNAKDIDFENRSVEKGDIKSQVIGVFSLTQSMQQIPFAVTLAEIYGEKASVLLLDLQEYSGLREVVFEYAQEDVLGMEDYMAMVSTGACTRGSLLAGIGHEQNWDYIYPVRNTECLAEGSEQIFGKIIRLLEEQGYDVIVINFGCIFTGIFTLMEYCKDFYFLVLKGEHGNWREKEFLAECQKRGKHYLLEKMIRFELPNILGNCEDWKKLVPQWKWNPVGDKLREIIWNR